MVGINLIPETLQFAQVRRRHIKRWVASLLSAAVILAIPLTIDRVQRAEAIELARGRSRLEGELVAVRRDVETTTVQVNETRRQLERAIALRAKRPWSAVFTMIEQRMPEGCWLVSIATDPAAPRGSGSASVPSRGTRPAVEPSRANSSAMEPSHGNRSTTEPPRGNRPTTEPSRADPAPGDSQSVVVIEAPRKLVVTGYALDAADPHAFVTNLKQAGVFTNVALEQVRREPVGQRSCLRFELVCEW